MKSKQIQEHENSSTASKKQTVLYQLSRLEKMTLSELQTEWATLNGGQAATGFKRQFLLKKIAWRIQEIHYGGLSQAALDNIKKRAEQDPMARLDTRVVPTTGNSKGILPGTRFVRIWGTERYEVIALEKGFEFNNQVYRSLSAIAKEITGAHWNGRAFFGMGA